jgi:hypothetical protein
VTDGTIPAAWRLCGCGHGAIGHGRACPHCGARGPKIAARTAQAGDGAAVAIDGAAAASQGGKAAKKRREPTQTELAYRDAYLDDFDPVFEGLTVVLRTGRRYKPDWVVQETDRRIECHEVKGKHRLPSYERSRMAWEQARLDWPAIRWVWAELGEDGTWRVEG